MASIFNKLEVGAQIEVFALNKICLEDTFKDKVNLTVGGKFNSCNIYSIKDFMYKTRKCQLFQLEYYFLRCFGKGHCDQGQINCTPEKKTVTYFHTKNIYTYVLILYFSLFVFVLRKKILYIYLK